MDETVEIEKALRRAARKRDKLRAAADDADHELAGLMKAARALLPLRAIAEAVALTPGRVHQILNGYRRSGT